MSQTSDPGRASNTATANDILGVIASSQLDLECFSGQRHDFDEVATNYEQFFVRLGKLTNRATKKTLRAAAVLHDSTLKEADIEAFSTLVAKTVLDVKEHKLQH